MRLAICDLRIGLGCDTQPAQIADDWRYDEPAALLGRSAGSDFLREMIGLAAQPLMALEVGGLTGAGYAERSDDRLAQRNGHRERA